MICEVSQSITRKENGLGRWRANLMIEEYQICDNYHVRSGSYYKYEIKDQFVCIQKYPPFAHGTTSDSFLILVG